MFGIDGDLIRWAATGLATVAGWLIGRHDKLRSAKERQKQEEREADEQRKREQAAARQAAKALAEAMTAKNAEIAYLRGQNEHLMGLLLRAEREGHG